MVFRQHKPAFSETCLDVPDLEPRVLGEQHTTTLRPCSCAPRPVMLRETLPRHATGTATRAVLTRTLQVRLGPGAPALPSRPRLRSTGSAVRTWAGLSAPSHLSRLIRQVILSTQLSSLSCYTSSTYFCCLVCCGDWFFFFSQFTDPFGKRN